MTNALPRWQVELDVMSTVYRELRRLTQTEQDRALQWALARLAAERTSQPKIEITEKKED